MKAVINHAAGCVVLVRAGANKIRAAVFVIGEYGIRSAHRADFNRERIAQPPTGRAECDVSVLAGDGRAVKQVALLAVFLPPPDCTIGADVRENRRVAQINEVRE